LYLQKLSILNFKNYQQVDLNFSSKINCFIGNNGVGKTNLLDSIHYLSLCKSFFNPIDSQNIRHDGEFFLIQGMYIDKDDNIEEIYCSFKRNGRKVMKRNKKEYERLSEHIGFVPVVMITPSDSSLILGGSEERRKLIDSIISQYDKAYLNELIQYNRVLQQRNKTLKDLSESVKFDPEMIEVYNEQLSPLGDNIYNKRKDFVEEFKTVFQKYYSSIAGSDEPAELAYQSHLHETSTLKLLHDNIGKDKVLEYTSYGIHKDDLLLGLNGYSVKKYASQGQQKTYLVALKLAEFDFIELHSGKKPLLLLDDIFDKFDPLRVKQIIHLASDDHFGQIFITDTELQRIESVLKEISFDHSIFKVENGSINQLSK
jgi:DNA replication and repair protein RecF